MRRFYWIVFILADGALIALFLAGYAAKYVHPVYLWWIGAIAIGFPYLSVALIVPTIIVLWKRKWRWVVVHGLLLLLAIVRMSPYGRFFRTSEPAPDDFTLMTFNVPRWGSQDMPEMTKEMKGLVRSEIPDVICLQEASLHYDPDDSLLQAEPYVAVLYDSLGYQTITPLSEGEAHTPQPVFSRFHLVEQTETILELDEQDNHRGEVTRTHLRWQDRDLVLYNVRFHSLAEDKPWQQADSSFWDIDSWKAFIREYRSAYQAQAWEVEQIRVMLQKETQPVILCGDFNSTPHNWVYGRLARHLQDAFALAGKGMGLTYHSRLPIARIDFVLASTHWVVTSAHLPDASLSDHRPLIVNLRWKN